MSGSLTKGQIGKEDLEIQSNANAAETFTRTSSTGGVTSLTKIPDIWNGTGKIDVKEAVIDTETVTTSTITTATITTATITAATINSIAITSANIFPSGTKMLFYQDTAPTGWTIANTLNDKVVFITKGSVAGGETGGGVHTTGTWTISGFGGTTDSHTLLTAEMPAHTHDGFRSASWLNAAAGAGAYGNNNSDSTTNSTGGGGGHTHNISANLTQDASWRPAAYCCIIATKD